MRNDKINYIQVENKIYRVTELSFYYMSLTAEETGLSIEDVPEDELFDVMIFKDMKITLMNSKGQASIIELAEWKQSSALAKNE